MYYPDDDGTQPLDHLPANAAHVLDSRANNVLFDGRRGHAVRAFTGERYSCVFFSVSNYEQIPAGVRVPLGRHFPDSARMSYLLTLLAPMTTCERRCKTS